MLIDEIIVMEELTIKEGTSKSKTSISVIVAVYFIEVLKLIR